MEQTGAWLLTQGVLGFTTLGLIGVVWRLWTALEACRRENAALQKEEASRALALLERVLIALQATDSKMDDNTKAIEMALRRTP